MSGHSLSGLHINDQHLSRDSLAPYEYAQENPRSQSLGPEHRRFFTAMLGTGIHGAIKGDPTDTAWVFDDVGALKFKTLCAVFDLDPEVIQQRIRDNEIDEDDIRRAGYMNIGKESLKLSKRQPRKVTAPTPWSPRSAL